MTSTRSMKRTVKLCLLLIAGTAVISCTAVPQPEVLKLSNGVSITIMQGCPMMLTRENLKSEDPDGFAIDPTSFPSPNIWRKELSTKSHVIIMEAGSYDPEIELSCTAESRHSFIRVDGVPQSAVSIRPVENWREVAGDEALAGYEKNVRDCERTGPRWTKFWTKLTITRGEDDQQIVAEGWGGCNYHVNQMSQAMFLDVPGHRFIVSKIVDDLFVKELM